MDVNFAHTETDVGSTRLHENTVKKILLWVSENRMGWTVWKNNTGSAKIGSGYVRYGLVGSPDIIGFDDTGKFIGIEVKTGNARQSQPQKRFQKVCEMAGGKYFLVRPGSIMDEVIR